MRLRLTPIAMTAPVLIVLLAFTAASAQERSSSSANAPQEQNAENKSPPAAIQQNQDQTTAKANNYDYVRNIASAVQSIAIAVAVVIGGCWTLYLFRVRREREKAESEAEHARRQLHEQAYINPTIESEVVADSGGGWNISVIITLENKGSRDIRVDFVKRPLAVASMEHSSSGEIRVNAIRHFPLIGFSDPAQTQTWDVPYWILEAGSVESFPFWVTVPATGLYLIGFKAGLTGPEAVDVPMKAGGEEKHIFSVQVREFVLVTSEIATSQRVQQPAS